MITIHLPVFEDSNYKYDLLPLTYNGPKNAEDIYLSVSNHIKKNNRWKGIFTLYTSKDGTRSLQYGDDIENVKELWMIPAVIPEIWCTIS